MCPLSFCELILFLRNLIIRFHINFDIVLIIISADPGNAYVWMHKEEM